MTKDNTDYKDLQLDGIRRYAVFYFDILGQSNLQLPCQNDYQNVYADFNEFSEEHKELFKKAVHGVVAFRSILQSSINYAIDKTKKRHSHIPNINIPIRNIVGSDCMFVTAELNQTEKSHEILTLSVLLTAIAGAYLGWLDAGIFVRGGGCISYGIILPDLPNMPGGDYYGPGLACSAKMESEKACFPRIIIDTNVANVFRTNMLKYKDSNNERFVYDLAKYTFEYYFVKDVDAQNEHYTLFPRLAFQCHPLIIKNIYKNINSCIEKYNNDNRIVEGYKKLLSMLQQLEAQLPKPCPEKTED